MYSTKTTSVLPKVISGALAAVLLLPLSLTPKIMVTLTIIVPIGGFGLIGIRDGSLTRWLGCWWRWRKNRRLIFYRGVQK